MSDFIEDFYYGNIEPQECTTSLTPKLKKSLSELAGKEEQLTSLLTDKENELFLERREYISHLMSSYISRLHSRHIALKI